MNERNQEQQMESTAKLTAEHAQKLATSQTQQFLDRLKKGDVNKFFEYGDFEVDPNGDFKKIILKSKMIEITGYNNVLYFGMTDEVYFYLETIHNA